MRRRRRRRKGRKQRKSGGGGDGRVRRGGVKGGAGGRGEKSERMKEALHERIVAAHSCSQLQVKVALNPLLGNCLGNSFGVATLKLTREEVPKPSFQQWDNTTHEEHPHTPARGPDSNTWSLPNRSLRGKEYMKG